MNILKRYLNDEKIIEKLKKEELFKDKLLPDIKKQIVFPAIRENEIMFYYYNSLLFKYDGIFKTHPKFAFVPSEYKKSYVSDGNEVGKIANFYDGYENIKERAKLYASPEAIGVYSICKSGNAISNSKYIVLDTEIAFEKTKELEPKGTINQIETEITEESSQKGNAQDRIDILLYGIKEKELLFVEAKHFSNNGIWTSSEKDVVSQIKRYNYVIAQKKEEILDSYKKYINNINELFADNLIDNLPEPETIYPQCGLIIFGFDGDQKGGRLEIAKEKMLNNNIKLYNKGNYKKIDIKNIYDKLRD